MVIGEWELCYGKGFAADLQVPLVGFDPSLYLSHDKEYDINKRYEILKSDKAIYEFSQRELSKTNYRNYKNCLDIITRKTCPREFVIHMSSKYMYDISTENKTDPEDEKYDIFLGNRGFTDDFRSPGRVFNKNKPKFYVCMGTILNGNENLLKSIIEVTKDYEVILSCGGNKTIFVLLKKTYKENNDQYKDLTIELFVNQKAILQDQADIYFCHGGASSIYEAIWFQTPMIMIPGGADQYINSEVVEKKQKIGTYLRWFESTDFIESIKICVENVVENYNLYKNNMAEAKKSFLEALTYEQTVVHIENLVKERKNEMIPNKIATTLNTVEKIEKQNSDEHYKLILKK